MGSEISKEEELLDKPVSDTSTSLDDSYDSIRTSLQVPHSLSHMMECPEHNKAFESLKFLTDLPDLKKFLVESDGFFKCPREKLKDLFAYFGRILITKIQTYEERKNGIIPHFFNHLKCKGLVIFIEFFRSSHIQVSIWKEAPLRKCKFYGDSRRVCQTLDYWIRKALTTWSTYSLIFNSCLHQAVDLRDPKDSSKNVLVNFSKTVYQMFILIGKASKQASQSRGHQEPLVPRISEPKCGVCFDNPPDHAFLPCGHKGCCEKCAKHIHLKCVKCPFCRKDVTSVVKIYDVLSLNLCS